MRIWEESQETRHLKSLYKEEAHRGWYLVMPVLLNGFLHWIDSPCAPLEAADFEPHDRTVSAGALEMKSPHELRP